MEISKALLHQGHYSWLLSSSVLIGGKGILFSITQGLTFEHTQAYTRAGICAHMHVSSTYQFSHSKNSSLMKFISLQLNTLNQINAACLLEAGFLREPVIVFR